MLKYNGTNDRINEEDGLISNDGSQYNLFIARSETAEDNIDFTSKDNKIRKMFPISSGLAGTKEELTLDTMGRRSSIKVSGSTTYAGDTTWGGFTSSMAFLAHLLMRPKKQFDLSSNATVPILFYSENGFSLEELSDYANNDFKLLLDGSFDVDVKGDSSQFGYYVSECKIKYDDRVLNISNIVEYIEDKIKNVVRYDSENKKFIALGQKPKNDYAVKLATLYTDKINDSYVMEIDTKTKAKCNSVISYTKSSGEAEFTFEVIKDKNTADHFIKVSGSGSEGITGASLVGVVEQVEKVEWKNGIIAVIMKDTASGTIQANSLKINITIADGSVVIQNSVIKFEDKKENVIAFKYELVSNSGKKNVLKTDDGILCDVLEAPFFEKIVNSVINGFYVRPLINANYSMSGLFDYLKNNNLMDIGTHLVLLETTNDLSSEYGKYMTIFQPDIQNAILSNVLLVDGLNSQSQASLKYIGVECKNLNIGFANKAITSITTSMEAVNRELDLIPIENIKPNIIEDTSSVLVQSTEYPTKLFFNGMNAEFVKDGTFGFEWTKDASYNIESKKFVKANAKYTWQFGGNAVYNKVSQDFMDKINSGEKSSIAIVGTRLLNRKKNLLICYSSQVSGVVQEPTIQQGELSISLGTLSGVDGEREDGINNNILIIVHDDEEIFNM